MHVMDPINSYFEGITVHYDINDNKTPIRTALSRKHNEPGA